MGKPSGITEKDFKIGDNVLVLGVYKGHPQYSNDVIVKFEADPSVTMPESYVSENSVLNVEHIDIEYFKHELLKLFSKQIEERRNRRKSINKIPRGTIINIIKILEESDPYKQSNITQETLKSLYNLGFSRDAFDLIRSKDPKWLKEKQND